MLLQKNIGKIRPLKVITNSYRKILGVFLWNWVFLRYLLSLYSEVPNRRAGLEKNDTLLAYLLSKSINEEGGIFRLLYEKLQAGWKENLKNFRVIIMRLFTRFDNEFLIFYKKNSNFHEFSDQSEWFFWRKKQ